MINETSKRRWILLFGTLVLILAMSGCGGEASPTKISKLDTAKPTAIVESPEPIHSPETAAKAGFEVGYGRWAYRTKM